MPAPKGNQYYKLAENPGRPRIFTDPAELQKKIDQYFQYCADNPICRNEVLKGGENAGTIVPVPYDRPYTIEGLTEYLGVWKQYLDQFEQNLDVENNPIDKEFSLIITYARNKVSRQKIEGATVGLYNPLIVSRIEGLKDRQEINQTSDIKVTVSDQEAQRIARKIKEDI